MISPALERTPGGTRNLPTRLAWAGMVVFVVALAIWGFQRDLFNYGTETDYVWSFVGEAQRILAVEPLDVSFHPPLFSAVIALAYSLVEDWLVAGLLVSILSCFAALALTFALFRKLLGLGAGVGSILALALSPVYIHFAMQATTEMFSLALYWAAFLAVVVSAERRSIGSCVLAGALIGLALITRTNNIALLALFLFYLIPMPPGSLAPPLPAKARSILLVSAGIAVPLIVWSAYAIGTGSPLMPTKNHENLALTYFAEGDRITGDPRLVLAERFTSTGQVLAEDPQRIMRIYLADLYSTTKRMLVMDTALPRPVIAMSVLCWLAILWRERRKRLLIAVLLVNLLGMYLLLNFKAYEDRYYLYFVPFFGASIGYVSAMAYGASRTMLARAVIASIITATVAVGAYHTGREARRLHLSAWSEDAFAAAEYLNSRNVSHNSVIIARKPHVARYAGAASGFMPQDVNIEALVDFLKQTSRDSSAPVFVFFGINEQRRRPDLSALADPDGTTVDDLVLVASGPEKGGWFLYELDQRQK